jgi:type IX secretion system PorP/SprF family membrane protein
MLDMKGKGWLYIFAMVLLNAGSAMAQDPRFSQVYAAPLQVNPALNGVFEGRFRAALNYRVLYPAFLAESPFRTFSGSFENRFRVIRRDYASLGLHVMQDEAGLGPYKRAMASFGAAYLKQLGADRRNRASQYLVAGFQGGMEQHTIGMNRLWFSSQYDRASNSVDLNQATGENISGDRSTVVPDLNIGLLWYSVMEEGKSVFAGVAAQHVLEPTLSFLGESGSNLYRKYTVHLGGEWPLSKPVSLLPLLLLAQQGPATSLTVGGSVRYTNKYWNEIALRSGLWAHFSNRGESSAPPAPESLAVGAIFETGRWNLGLSYDVTMSPLGRSNYNRGAFEVSLMYLQPAKERYKVRCPRY